MTEAQRVHGEIIVPRSGSPDRLMEVVVQVEDVSRMDAPSRVVAEQRRRVTLSGDGATLTFEVFVPADRIDFRSDYSIRVHISPDDTRGVEKGDFVSTRSYPVLTGGHGNTARIQVVPV